MKRIEILDKYIAERTFPKEINHTLFRGYRASLEAGNDHLDFNEVIWDEDIEPITDFLKENGIDEFTVSSNFSGLIPTLEAFEKHGFTISGLTKVRANYTDVFTNEKAIIPAIRLVNTSK